MEIKIGKHTIGPGHPTYFIADVAANHDGDLERARLLIRLAKEAGRTQRSSRISALPTSSRITAFKSLGDRFRTSELEKIGLPGLSRGIHPFEWTPILREECDRAGWIISRRRTISKRFDMLDPYVPMYKAARRDRLAGGVGTHGEQRQTVLRRNGRIDDRGGCSGGTRHPGNQPAAVLIRADAYATPTTPQPGELRHCT